MAPAVGADRLASEAKPEPGLVAWNSSHQTFPSREDQRGPAARGGQGGWAGPELREAGLGPRQPLRAVCLHRILVPTGAGSPLGTSVLKLRVIPQGDLAVAVIRPKVKADWAKAESLLCPVRPADAPRLPRFCSLLSKSRVRVASPSLRVKEH